MSDYWQAAIKLVIYGEVHTNLLVVKCQHVLGCSWFLHLVTTYHNRFQSKTSMRGFTIDISAPDRFFLIRPGARAQQIRFQTLLLAISAQILCRGSVELGPSMGNLTINNWDNPSFLGILPSFTITLTRLSPWSSSNPPSFTAKYGKIGGGKPVNEHLNPDASPQKSDLSQPSSGFYQPTVAVTVED